MKDNPVVYVVRKCDPTSAEDKIAQVFVQKSDAQKYVNDQMWPADYLIEKYQTR